MKLNIYNKKNNCHKLSEEGFSLIETAIALTTLGVCLAYAMPLFLYAKINNAKSEIRTGALIVSQRVFDDIRSKPFTEAAMPSTNGKTRDPEDPTNPDKPDQAKNYWIIKTDTSWKTATNTDGSNPIVMPVDASSSTSISASEKLLTFAMGRQYRTKVTYCPRDTTKVPVEDPVCTNNSRKFKVEVSFNGSKVYDLEGNYTNFQ
jgi:type II secretory pathway pseudopilin PulG